MKNVISLIAASFAAVTLLPGCAGGSDAPAVATPVFSNLPLDGEAQRR